MGRRRRLRTSFLLARGCFSVVFSGSSANFPSLLSRTKEQRNAMRPHVKTLILCTLAAALAFQSTPSEAQRRAGVREGTQAMNNTNAATRSLQKLLEDEWEWTMRENPAWASTLGDRRFNDRWEDASLENVERQYQHRVETRKRLRSIDRSKLNEADRLNYDLFEKDLAADIEQHKFKLYL